MKKILNFRNQVTFRVHPLDTVVLNIDSTHISITVCYREFKKRKFSCPLKDVCSAIYEAVEMGIRQVIADINYIDINAQYSFTFLCGCNYDHPGTLEFVGETPHCLSCIMTGKVFLLPKGHDLWPISKTGLETEADITAGCNAMKATSVQNQGHLTMQAEGGASMQQWTEPTKLTEHHHSDLLSQLCKHAKSWKGIGTHLGFTHGELNNIEAAPLLMTTAPTSWLDKMLEEWLQWAPEDERGSTSYATLESLKCALRVSGFNATAHSLCVCSSYSSCATA